MTAGSGIAHRSPQRDGLKARRRAAVELALEGRVLGDQQLGCEGDTWDLTLACLGLVSLGMPATSGRISGHLDSLLLAILEEAPLHGYAVIEELRRRSGGTLDLPEGTVYPALYRLERARLLKSAWSSGQGRRRRVYSMTAGGRRALAGERADWLMFSAAVHSILGGNHA